MLAAMFCDKENILIETIQIRALGNDKNIEGSFFLGSGNISGNLKYTYLEEKDGGVKLEQISADNTIVFEGNNKPRIEVYCEKYTNGFVNKLGLFTGFVKYKIYIPENSIKYDYNVSVN